MTRSRPSFPGRRGRTRGPAPATRRTLTAAVLLGGQRSRRGTAGLGLHQQWQGPERVCSSRRMPSGTPIAAVSGPRREPSGTRRPPTDDRGPGGLGAPRTPSLRAMGPERSTQGAAWVGRPGWSPEVGWSARTRSLRAAWRRRRSREATAGGDTRIAGLGPRTGPVTHRVRPVCVRTTSEGTITSVAVRREQGNPRRATRQRWAGNGASTTRTPRRSKASKSRHPSQEGGRTARGQRRTVTCARLPREGTLWRARASVRRRGGEAGMSRRCAETR